MPALLRLFVISIPVFFFSISGYASDDVSTRRTKPEYIKIIKEPCYVGCDYQFQYCYYYNIANMENSIKVKEWYIEDNYIKGKAAADIKAKLLMKACYQLSLSAAYPVIDDDINLSADFDFTIKIKNDECIEEPRSSIDYSSFELKGNVQKDPIQLMKTWLIDDMKGIIKDSVSMAVHDSLPPDKKAQKVYCGDKQYNTELTEEKCHCDY